MFEGNDSDPFEFSLRLSAAKVKWLRKNGRLIFGDVELGNMTTTRWRPLTRFDIEGQEKFLIGDFPDLTKRIRHFAPGLDLPRIHVQ